MSISPQPSDRHEDVAATTVFRPPYRYEYREHGPVTIYDALDVGWIARVKESLPHKEALASAMVDGLNAAAGRMTEREGARLLTGGSPDEGDAGSIPAPSAFAVVEHRPEPIWQPPSEEERRREIDGWIIKRCRICDGRIQRFGLFRRWRHVV